MAVIDFSRSSNFFCHPGSFFNENYWFLVVKFVFSMRVLAFWLQAFCKTVLWAFFPWNLKAFLKAELVFKESHTFLQQGHCFSKDSLILDGRN